MASIEIDKELQIPSEIWNFETSCIGHWPLGVEQREVFLRALDELKDLPEPATFEYHNDVVELLWEDVYLRFKKDVVGVFLFTKPHASERYALPVVTIYEYSRLPEEFYSWLKSEVSKHVT